MNDGFEDHLSRCNELLEMASRVVNDESIPVAERLDEMGRLLTRAEGHRAAAGFLFEVMESPS